VQAVPVTEVIRTPCPDRQLGAGRGGAYVQRHANLRQLKLETIFADCWSKLSPDGDGGGSCCECSSRVGRWMEGAGGT
jgi:hypothetical protein